MISTEKNPLSFGTGTEPHVQLGLKKNNIQIFKKMKKKIFHHFSFRLSKWRKSTIV